MDSKYRAAASGQLTCIDKVEVVHGGVALVGKHRHRAAAGARLLISLEQALCLLVMQVPERRSAAQVVDGVAVVHQRLDLGQQGGRPLGRPGGKVAALVALQGTAQCAAGVRESHGSPHSSIVLAMLTPVRSGPCPSCTCVKGRLSGNRPQTLHAREEERWQAAVVVNSTGT